MSPTEIKKLVENELPTDMVIDCVTYYNLSFIFTDSSGDQTVVTVDQNGEIVTREKEDSYGHKNGTAFRPEIVMFMWRLSRMAQDKPW